MLALAAKLEQICRVTGRVVAWLCLSMVVVTGIVVIERYAFDSGSIRLRESITFMHAVLFMLAAAYTLAAGDHVRVDVFYGSMSARGRALVDLCGSVLLLFPFCLFMLWTSWDFVSVSWAIREALRGDSLVVLVYFARYSRTKYIECCEVTVLEWLAFL